MFGWLFTSKWGLIAVIAVGAVLALFGLKVSWQEAAKEKLKAKQNAAALETVAKAGKARKDAEALPADKQREELKKWEK